jgi:hypothetical protein
MESLETAIAALPPPACPQGLGGQCPGPFDPITKTHGAPNPERVVATDVRPGEVDVSVRCRECQAVAHYVLDEVGKVLDGDALRAKRGEKPEDGSQKTEVV